MRKIIIALFILVTITKANAQTNEDIAKFISQGVNFKLSNGYRTEWVFDYELAVERLTIV